MVKYCLACLALLYYLAIPTLGSAASIRITVQASQSLLAFPMARSAIDDSIALLKQSFPEGDVSLNGRHAEICLIMPEIRGTVTTSRSKGVRRPYPVLAVPDSSYCWRSRSSEGRTVIRLEATSLEGVSCGIYGLLQEKLGIRFIHPRQTIIPVNRRWPLSRSFTFSGTPRFDKRGFHIHTLHPVELTEPLLDPRYPYAFEDARAYLDWLARNGQNTLQFFLLRDIDRDAWIPHARRIVEYAHRRGIRCGIEISIAMLQQQAFQAITLFRPYPSYRQQVDDTLKWLFQVDWDFLTLEATMGEYLPLVGKFLPELQTYLERQVMERYKARLLYATHVICQESGGKVRRPLLPESGILIHTVMCYSASEPKAPVYGNDNQCFMLQAARDENKRRETWYWPESSYWVGFDSSVPLLLLTYLDSRWQDMETMEKIGVSGHLTFTSGWEWGYWLMDWSIARWSWRYAENGHVRPTTPLSPLADLFHDCTLSVLWQQALDLQNRFLKEQELQRFVSALTPFSELPHPLDRPFQPDPGFSYSWLLHDASQEEAQQVLRGPVAGLESYAIRMEAVAHRLAARIDRLGKGRKISISQEALADELRIGLEVTALRARHRALTLRALIAQRGKLDRTEPGISLSGRLLAQAANVRLEALEMVLRQERHYRYPVGLIASRRQSLTAYPFGYLYPASGLFFWKREEEQIRRDRFDPFFMNLWDFRRTLGLESLFIKN